MTTQARPRRVEHQLTERGLVPVYASGVVDQPYADYSLDDHEVWSTLTRRQECVLTDRACPQWLESRQTLGLDPDRIPNFATLNEKLGPASGWKVVGVEGFLSPEDFYGLLAKREFPTTWWIRGKDQLDYLPEPDLFHDAYGHVPLLVLPVYAAFMEHYAHAALRACASGDEARERIRRLNWFTVEFGLLGTIDAPRIYGAGILSSSGESVHSVDNPAVERVRFDPEEIMNQPYRIDQMQNKYFVVKDLETLYREIKPVLEGF